jgi:hypothetical protein
MLVKLPDRSRLKTLLDAEKEPCHFSNLRAFPQVLELHFAVVLAFKRSEQRSKRKQVGEFIGVEIESPASIKKAGKRAAKNPQAMVPIYDLRIRSTRSLVV